MDKRRVLLLCVQPLLGEGLKHILTGLEDVELIGPWDLDSGVLSRLSEEAPDIVIVAEGDGEESEKGASLKL
jgi:DNA-binding NarL/FixJ family response regulator